MPYKIIEWDSVTQRQIERDATSAESAEIDARQQAASKPDVPQSVTMLQARLALGGNGMLAHANELVAEMKGEEGESARIHWQFAQNVLRTDPLVLTLVNQMGLSTEQTDQLFINAKAL